MTQKSGTKIERPLFLRQRQKLAKHPHVAMLPKESLEAFLRRRNHTDNQHKTARSLMKDDAHINAYKYLAKKIDKRCRITFPCMFMIFKVRIWKTDVMTRFFKNVYARVCHSHSLNLSFLAPCTGVILNFSRKIYPTPCRELIPIHKLKV